MYLNVDELRSFRVLAGELHFRRAAEKLAISQPALSKQIRRLEEKVAGRVFARTRRKVTLTETGRVLLPFAEQLLQQLEVALSMAREASSGTAGTLRVGYGLATIHDILPRTILRFRRKYPHIRLQLKDMSTPAQVASLVEGALDIGFVRLPVPFADLESLTVIRERLVLAAPESLRFQSKLGLKSLRNESFVILSRLASATFYDHAMSVCRRAGLIPNVVQEAHDTFTILNFVRAGLGVSLVQSAAIRMNVPGIRYHQLRIPECEWDIGIVWNPKGEKHGLTEKFIAVMRAVVGT
jgi:DNA-binding transcriptional LysR family regulator